MISKEEFIELISKHKKWDDRVDEIGKVLDCSLIDLDWIEYGYNLFGNVISSLFTEDGADIINWWLYEKPLLSTNSYMQDADGNEIPTDTIEDLWNVVEPYRK